MKINFNAPLTLVGVFLGIFIGNELKIFATKGCASALMKEESLGEIKKWSKSDLVALDLNESHL